ncbi:hypothetical protein NEISICOT_00043 [Neisseria sicca ATCC 29256]|uniref:Uncharacterized protein n=1 Tax=Neisseria sicca ATCC 29256 TaxID=547045 RepID=C6M0L8_NEISI|nr:hypothetical protein NEISICOT_00043 [Neisseria sicca ATCC 29256]RKV76464.1 MAG: phosphorylase [Neisseria sp.]
MAWTIRRHPCFVLKAGHILSVPKKYTICPYAKLYKEIFGKSYYACTNFNKVKFHNEKITYITNSFRIFIRLLCRCG